MSESWSLKKSPILAIRSIGRIRKYLSLDGLKMLVKALFISWLDYCNCLLYGIPKYQRDKLQRIQNTAARLVKGPKCSDHVTPILKNLHWLPVEKRIEFKILLRTYKTIHDQSADILGDPGAFSRVGRKGATKVFKHGRKSPWVTTVTKLFPKIQADVGSRLGTKNALYYYAQSANSFSWVLFVSSYTTAIILPHLPGSGE